MARLIFHRKKQTMGTALRLKIYLNNKEVTILRVGGTDDLQLPAGSYVISGKIDFLTETSKVHFNIGENETLIYYFEYINLNLFLISALTDFLFTIIISKLFISCMHIAKPLQITITVILFLIPFIVFASLKNRLKFHLLGVKQVDYSQI